METGGHPIRGVLWVAANMLLALQPAGEPKFFVKVALSQFHRKNDPRKMHPNTWWGFRPRKKIFSPPPSPQIPRRHPPGPLAPHPSLETPLPPAIFNQKPSRPPSGRAGLPPSPPPSRKNNKYPKRPSRICQKYCPSIFFSSPNKGLKSCFSVKQPKLLAPDGSNGIYS